MIRVALIFVVAGLPVAWSTLGHITAGEASSAIPRRQAQEPRNPSDTRIKPESVQVEALLDVVRDKELQSKDPERVAQAIEQLGHLRSRAAIPDLVELLTFRRVYSWERPDSGVQMHPVSPLGRYPAAGALFEIGLPALPALNDVLYSAEVDSQAIASAVEAIRTIYERTDPAEGIVYFERVAADPGVHADGAQLQRATEWLRSLVPSKGP